MNLYVELLVFLGFEYPVVSIVIGFEDSIESHWECVRGRNGVVIRIWLGLQCVGDVYNAKHIWGWGNHTFLR